MDSKEMRQTGIDVLSTAVKQKQNSTTFEKYIYKQAVKLAKDNFEDLYTWILYQVVGLLLLDINNMKATLKMVKKGKVGWTSPTYDGITERLQEHDDFIVMPFEVVEGVVECPKCGSTKTWSVQRQTRGADEPMTTFSRCAKCSHNWRYSG